MDARLYRDPTLIRAAARAGRSVLHVLCGALLSLAMTGEAAFAAEPIFRCTDEAGRVTYTSIPCKGGVELDIDAGKPDPAAIERLRNNVEIDRQNEARRQMERAQDAAYRASIADWQYRQASPMRDDTAQDYLYSGGYCDYCGAWSLFPYYPPHPQRPLRKHVRHQSVVPAHIKRP